MSDVVETTGTRWFKFTVFAVSGFMAGVSLANVIYYNRIRTESCDAVTKGQARSMYIINIIIFIVSFALFIWSAVKIFFTQQARQHASQLVTDKIDQAKKGLTGRTKGVFEVDKTGKVSRRVNLFTSSSGSPAANVT